MIKCAFLFMALSFTVGAQTLEIEYKRFYSHIKKLDNDDTVALQFAFGFMHVSKQTLCPVNDAYIVTQKQTLPLSVSEEHRFTMPSERALNLAEASVRVELTEPANMCDLSVQLETKPEYLKTQYSKKDLANIRRQYAAFFNEMGSFLSFMMPTVKGLMIHFSQPVNAVLPSGQRINQGMLILEDEELQSIEQLQLPELPLRITALARR